ncbi:MAG: hypothetical protein C0609_10970 [Deltaproteobacteria bacterium]|nr:MAG: hypothetical protein C0609_10970 [Deltaproteobacteria bacterium]
MYAESGRRRYPRVPSKNTILVKKLSPPEMEGFTKTRVVGLGGCSFVADEAFGPGSYCDVLISVKKHVIKALCKVVYEILEDDGKIEVGSEFIQISDTDRQLLEVLWNEEQREERAL